MKFKLIKNAFIYMMTLTLCLSGTISAETISISNDRYNLDVDTETKSIKLLEKASDESIIIYPTFIVQYKSYLMALSLEKVNKSTDDVNYSVISWGRNYNVFKVADNYYPEVDSVFLDTLIRFTYIDDELFSLRASLALPQGDEEPIIAYTLEAKKHGAYSVGFYGMPAHQIDSVEELWQPMVWTEKKFPGNSYLTPSSLCSLPATLTTVENKTFGVVVDADEFPFVPMPTFERSTFGVAIRNSNSEVQPMTFAPIVGSKQSELNSGECHEFKIRLYLHAAPIENCYEDIARRLYKFGSHKRHNALGSLNETLDNMIDYAMSNYSRFNSELKGCSYQTDVPGAVKNVSPLNPINLAFVTDDTSIYNERALPMIEFFLSREKNLFKLNPGPGDAQAPDNKLGEPVISCSDAAALYSISGKSMKFLLELARSRMYEGDIAFEKSWRDNLSLFRATDDNQFLDKAVSGSEMYISSRLNSKQTYFGYQYHLKNSFWSSFAPKFPDLMEMYETTGNNKYVEAARTSAKMYSKFIWMAPTIPDSSITVNQGNQAPVYWYTSGPPMYVAEETVPAWRLSETGLLSEAAASCTGHRAIFMANHGSYFLRIAALTGDSYLEDIANAAIIGRYTNFPGYHMNTDRSTIFEQPNFPLRSHSEITTTSMHYNHVYPMISFLYDYLVTDAFLKSNQQIYFPSEFVEGYAYLQNRLYGFKPGRFYDDDNVILWMPRKLLTSSNEEVNYITARGNGKIYFAFMNQSEEEITSTINVNEEIISLPGGNTFDISIEPGGITTRIIDDVSISTALQDKMMNISSENSWEVDYMRMDFASARAMLINMGTGLSEIYVYSGEPMGTFSELTINYRFSGKDYVSVTDTSYPFEFEIPLPDSASKFNFQLISKSADGIIEKSSFFILADKADLKAEIRGCDVILQGENSELEFNFSGSPPWNIIYTNGVEEIEIDSIYSNPFYQTVSPEVSTTYSLVSVSNDEGIGDVSGTAQIDVADIKQIPFLDGMVRQYYKDGQWGLDYLSVKDAQSWSRETYLCFDDVNLNDRIYKAVLKLYLKSADNPGDVIFNVNGMNKEITDELSWQNRPSEDEFSVAGESLVKSKDDVNSYFIWDVTEYVNSLIDDNVHKFTLKISAEDNKSEKTLFKFKAVEDSSGNDPALMIVTDNPTSVAVNNYVVTDYKLYQNYPNPFNPVTEICYDLKTASDTKLTVYNTLGQEVIQLVNAYQDAGKYNVMWNGRDKFGNLMSSGVYFYRIESSTFIQSNKMIYLK